MTVSELWFACSNHQSGLFPLSEVAFVSLFFLPHPWRSSLDSVCCCVGILFWVAKRYGIRWDLNIFGVAERGVYYPFVLSQIVDLLSALYVEEALGSLKKFSIPRGRIYQYPELRSFFFGACKLVLHALMHPHCRLQCDLCSETLA